MAFFLTLFMSTWFARENARRDELALQTGTGPMQGEITEEQKAMERELADRVPWFRYMT